MTANARDGHVTLLLLYYCFTIALLLLIGKQMRATATSGPWHFTTALLLLYYLLKTS